MSAFSEHTKAPASSRPVAPRAAADRRIAVICNPGSGRLREMGDFVDRITEAFGDCGTMFRVGRGELPAQTANRAASAGATTLVAAGGDGTIMAVAEVAMARDLELGVLPLGTFNFFARGYGIPPEFDAAARVIRSCSSRRVDVGEVNGRPFLNNASLGIYPQILRNREGVYRRFGRRRLLAYWSVMDTFRRFQSPLRVNLELHDERVARRTPLIFVARSEFQVEQYGLDGADCVRHGNFAVYVAPDGGRRELFRAAWNLVRRRMTPGIDFELLCVDKFRVTGHKRRVLVACDGEKFRMSCPLDFRVRRGALRLICPDEAE